MVIFIVIPDNDFGYGIPDYFQAFLDNISSVSEFSTPMDVLVFPNPTEDQITFQSMNEEILSIQIVDLSGKILYHNSDKQFKNTISVSFLSSGIYFAHLKTATSKGTIKFVKR